jgi:hypothetical protein
MGISNKVKVLFFAFLILFSFVGCKGGCNDGNASTPLAVYSINFYDENLDFIETASKSKEYIVNSGSWYRAGEISPVTYQDITDDIRLYALSNVTEITNQEELDSIRNALYGKYILLNDIDLNGSGAGFDNAMGWEPITGYHGVFMGIFNGNSHKITNLWIDRASDDYIGLFGYAVNAQIRNLGVETADGKKIKGYKYVGGIAGHVTYGGITKSYSIGDVSGYEAVGGMAGKISESNITNAYSIGNVSGDYEVGGIAGHIKTDSSITNAYSAGSINGHHEAGGIAGYAVNSSVKNSAAINLSVTGASHVNRAVGYIYGSGNDISNNLARSALNSGFSDYGDGNEYSGTGKADNDFLDENTYKIGLSWKFGNDGDNPWKIKSNKNNGYPYLYYQE